MLSGRPSNIADVSAGCRRRKRVQNEEEVIAVLRIALQQRMGERLLDDDVEEARRLIVSDHRSNVCFGLARSELHFSLNDEVASAGSPGIRHGSLCRPLSETVLHEADGESAAPMPPSHECSSDLCRLAAHPILGHGDHCPHVWCASAASELSLPLHPRCRTQSSQPARV